METGYHWGLDTTRNTTGSILKVIIGLFPKKKKVGIFFVTLCSGGDVNRSLQSGTARFCGKFSMFHQRSWTGLCGRLTPKAWTLNPAPGNFQKFSTFAGAVWMHRPGRGGRRRSGRRRGPSFLSVCLGSPICLPRARSQPEVDRVVLQLWFTEEHWDSRTSSDMSSSGWAESGHSV